MRLIKRCVKAFFMSFGMFCVIPLPFKTWDNSCMDLILPCFPLVGLFIGTIWWSIARLLVYSQIHIMLTAAILTVFPFFLSGFLHLDGYMDTNDAILSRRPLEDKLRILKDPHTGAFSVITLVILFTIQFSVVYALIDGKKGLISLIFISLISRCCASVSILSLKAMTQSSYVNMFKQSTNISHRGFVIAITILIFLTAFFFTGFRGLVVVVCVVVGFTAAMAYSYREFKGISGDLTGYSLVISELCGLSALSVL